MEIEVAIDNLALDQEITVQGKKQPRKLILSGVEATVAETKLKPVIDLLLPSSSSLKKNLHFLATT